MNGMSGMIMSEMEKLRIQTLIRTEELCTKKAQVYLNQHWDPSVQSLLQQTVDKGRMRVSALNSLLQGAGLSGH